MDLFDLSNKVAIVTGGNGGIGLGMARGLAAAGATLAVVGRNAEKNQIAVDELGANARAFVADVTNAAEVDEMVSEVVKSFGGIDILINNAGTNIRKRPEDLSESEWHHVLDLSLIHI